MHPPVAPSVFNPLLDELNGIPRLDKVLQWLWSLVRLVSRYQLQGLVEGLDNDG